MMIRNVSVLSSSSHLFPCSRLVQESSLTSLGSFSIPAVRCQVSGGSGAQFLSVTVTFYLFGVSLSLKHTSNLARSSPLPSLPFAASVFFPSSCDSSNAASLSDHGFHLYLRPTRLQSKTPPTCPPAASLRASFRSLILLQRFVPVAV